MKKAGSFVGFYICYFTNFLVGNFLLSLSLQIRRYDISL